jgi:hypothetical protein
MDNTTTTARLLDAYFTGGVAGANFFNGRVLTAEALRDEQDAQREGRERLGRAVGAGVVRGLWVSPGSVRGTLAVTRGEAVNPAGQTLRLADGPVTVHLVPPTAVSDAGASAGGCGGARDFGDCVRLPASSALGDEGAYLLAVRPAARLEGSVPRKGIGRGDCGCGEGDGCDARWERAGVRFVAVALPFKPPSGNLAGLLRNLLAHACYDSPRRARRPVDPFRFLAEDAGLHRLPGLTEADVPLAVFYWRGGTPVVVDTWGARRRVAASYPAEGWGAFVSDSRLAENEARFLQFQAHLEDVRAASPETRREVVTDRFRFLPPAGFVPIRTPDDRDKNAAGRAFDWFTFFGAFLPERVAIVDRDTITDVLHRSFRDEAIDLRVGATLSAAGPDTASGHADVLRRAFVRRRAGGDPAERPDDGDEDPSPFSGRGTVSTRGDAVAATEPPREILRLFVCDENLESVRGGRGAAATLYVMFARNPAEPRVVRLRRGDDASSSSSTSSSSSRSPSGPAGPV